MSNIRLRSLDSIGLQPISGNQAQFSQSQEAQTQNQISSSGSRPPPNIVIEESSSSYLNNNNSIPRNNNNKTSVEQPTNQVTHILDNDLRIQGLYDFLMVLAYFMTAALTAVTALDFFINRPDPFTPPASSKTIILLGCYAALSLTAFFVSVNRLVRVKLALSNIPKFSMPLRKYDMPYPLYERIYSQLARCLAIPLEPIAKDINMNGWGLKQDQPGSPDDIVSPSNSSNNQRLKRTTTFVSPKSDGIPTSASSKFTPYRSILQQKYVYYKLSVLNTFVLIQSAVVAKLSSMSASPQPTVSLTSSPSIQLSTDTATSTTGRAGGQLLLEFVSIPTTTIESNASLNSNGLPNSQSTQHLSSPKFATPIGKKLPHVSVAEYLTGVATRFDIDAEIMAYYIYIFTKSRLSQHELTAEEYRDAMKCVVFIVKRYLF